MNATDMATTLVPLDVARVRIEPRLLSPLPPVNGEATYQLQIAGLASRPEAEQKARDVREATGTDAQIAYDTATKTWGLLVGARRSLAEAEELRAKLEEAGFDASVMPLGGTSSSVTPSATVATRARGTTAQPDVMPAAPEAVCVRRFA